jgi:hypothetical protein
MCADYEAEFDTDLEELRAKWRITPAPKAPKRKPRNECWGGVQRRQLALKGIEDGD